MAASRHPLKASAFTVLLCICIGWHAGEAVSSSQPGDENWDDRFHMPGMDNFVKALAVSGAGDVYVGGDFSFAGGVPAGRVAMWSGGAWSALGAGFDEYCSIQAMAINGADVYIGGSFGYAGGVAANNIAMWDGASWSALGEGTGDAVHALAVQSGYLYAGGRFETAGGVEVNGIAAWNGSEWSAIGKGYGLQIYYGDNCIYAIAAGSSNIYAGGSFTMIDSVTANNIAVWDGAAWDALGSGIQGVVNSIAVDGADVYVGGSITSAGGIPVNNVARWDGFSWHALGSGVNKQVYAVLVIDGEVYASSWFNDVAPPYAVSHVYRWNGVNWSTLGEGLKSYDNFVPQGRAMAARGDSIYVGGGFQYAGDVHTQCIAMWDGGGWNSLDDPDSAIGLGGSLNSDRAVWALALDESGLYAGGNISTAGGVPARNIAWWDGGAWHALGSGIDSTVFDIALSGGDIYAGGFFQHAGGVDAYGIARWDGISWGPVGEIGAFPFNIVIAVEASGSDIYMGGYFTSVDWDPAGHIAKWNGSVWDPMGGGVTVKENYVPVLAIAATGGSVYAGGYFSHAGGVPADNIARWDGASWYPLGDGVNGWLYDIEVFYNNLYVSGSFDSAGSAPARNVAMWDGENWNPLGDGINGTVYALAAGDNGLFAVGSFDSAGGVPASNIARWDGMHWSAMGSGLNGPGYDLLLDGDDLYVGGGFTEAGGKVSLHIGIYHDQPIAGVDDFLPPERAVLHQNYPNPFNPATTIGYELPTASDITIRIFDVRGGLIRTLVKGYQAGGVHATVWDGRDDEGRAVASGVYLCRIETQHYKGTRKLVLLR